MSDRDKLTNKERFGQIEEQIEALVRQVHVLTTFAREVSPVLDSLRESVADLEDEGPKTGLILPDGRRV